MSARLIFAAALVSCAHVPPPSQAGVPTPWPEARGVAGETRSNGNAPRTPPAIQRTPGGAVMKSGTPPPVVPLVKQPPDAPPPDKSNHDETPPSGGPPKLERAAPAWRTPSTS